MLCKKIRPSLAILKNCPFFVALPVLPPESVNQVDIPSWSLGNEKMIMTEENPYRKMIKLLLAKVSDYLVPGYQVSQQALKEKPTEEEKELTITDMEDPKN